MRLKDQVTVWQHYPLLEEVAFTRRRISGPTPRRPQGDAAHGQKRTARNRAVLRVSKCIECTRRGHNDLSAGRRNPQNSEPPLIGAVVAEAKPPINSSKPRRVRQHF